MRLFLDSSVLLAAGGSPTGASREIFRRASPNEWSVVSTPYVIEEVIRNLPDLPATATADWVRLRPALSLMDDVLTLDREDFGELMGGNFYGLPLLKPGAFLERERTAGRLR